jgi:ribosomal silencing factor RsfS
MSIETRQQVAQAVRAVESKKGEGLAILEMDRTTGPFTDYFVVCTGTNPRQVQAISD